VFGGSVDCVMQSSVACLLCHSGLILSVYYFFKYDKCLVIRK
jgi:hypothetical protein